MKKIYYIYQLTNISNKKNYIGYTHNPKLRLRQHRNTVKENKGSIIHKAIRKYGWPSFIFEELYCTFDKSHALEMEDVFINLYESKGPKGYNVTRGGQFGPPKNQYKIGPMPLERKLKISASKNEAIKKAVEWFRANGYVR